MKTKDLVEFLEQFDPDSDVYFNVTMFNEKKVLVAGAMVLGAVCREDVPDAPVIHLDSDRMEEMPEEVAQFWESSFEETLAEAKRMN